MASNGLYIVDNSNENKQVKKYLTEWCGISKQMDIATGYWEIGGLLALDGDWQKLDKIRIILGNEVTRRTLDVIEDFKAYFDNGIDREKEKNEFLIGVPAILNAMISGKIECRVYSRSKFHAKAYITYFKDEYKEQFISGMNLPDGYALVGSSNFTSAGLMKNIELNVQVSNDVEQLQEWYEEKWENGEDITQAVLDVIEKHCKEYSPYEVYLRSMYELFKTREKSVSEWENHDSRVYKQLSQYQRDGYNNLVDIADKYKGAFLCDGVGLGKTFVGLMLIERFVIKEGKRVVLMVPAAARVSVWENSIKKYMPEILGGFLPFKIINHTDLTLDKNYDLIEQIKDHADIILIDEAHHFRNRSTNRYRKLYEIIGNGSQKKLFMLTATPINNSFLDLQHLIELFTQRREDYFSDAPLGIHSLAGHFQKMENRLNQITGTDVNETLDISDDIFKEDKLINELVVQRSRAYVKESLKAEETDSIKFPERQAPEVANYSMRKSYGDLIDHFVNSFNKIDSRGRKYSLLSLPIYSPYESTYFIGDLSKVDPMKVGRQQQIVSLIRQLLLKRFESSIEAFKETCIKIYFRLERFLEEYKSYGNIKFIDNQLNKQAEVIAYVNDYILNTIQTEIEDFEDELPDYVWEVEDNNLTVEDFDIRAMLDDTVMDMEVLAEFINDMRKISPESDDKIRELKVLLTSDERLKNKKVIIFTEYRATAKYIERELEKAQFSDIYEIDGQTKGDRHEMIQRFAPYYNDKTSSQINREIRILIATDVLAEGLNLQDASCIINYELHWNPVRLMQRIGRIDRRRDATIEEKLLEDHPNLRPDRAKAYLWNFLPPKELEQLLSLYEKVSKKTLRISKTFGIEGKKLLTPDDDFDALKDFNSQYEGSTSGVEEMALAYQKLLSDNPGYLEAVQTMPKKIYSGKAASTKKGYFFCYSLPSKNAEGKYTEESRIYRWYFYDNGIISEQTYEIWKAIECETMEPRKMSITQEAFAEIRNEIKKYIRKNYLKQIVAPAGEDPVLITWMELC